MAEHQVVSHEQWLEARKALLAREKEFTRLRDQLSAERRALPPALAPCEVCWIYGRIGVSIRLGAGGVDV